MSLPLGAGIRIVDLPQLRSELDGAVVVIDVLRAFTTAAVAFARGAASVTAVSEVADAFELRRRDPTLALVGEVDGLPIEGFDYPNSPAVLAASELTGARLIQRTTAGTRGLVRAGSAQQVLAASFATAGATARWLRCHAPAQVTFVVTGSHSADAGEEDRACAEYLAELLDGGAPEAGSYLARVRSSAAAAKFAPGGPLADWSADVDEALRLDRLAAVMLADTRGRWPVLRASPVKDATVKP